MGTQRHKVFISYHHGNDQGYRDLFENMFTNIYDIMVNQSVGIGEIPDNLKTETVRQIIRDKYLRDTTVTVVLIGTETWKRRHVDWEISSSIRQTAYNPRSGLLGIFLPTYTLTADNKYNPYTIPPRLYKNAQCGFAKLYKWTEDPHQVQGWIHDAFINRLKIQPDNSYPMFGNNRSGSQWQ